MKPIICLGLFGLSISLLLSQPTEDIYYIPVIVHVVHNGEPIGEGANISLEQVQSQIEVLNEDFRRREGTLGFNDSPLGADTRIEFFLAEYDPEGNILPEPGIDRVDGGRAIWPKGAVRNPIDRQIKPLTIWDPNSYFNIWTVNFGGFVSRDLLGYAQFPDESGLGGLDKDEGNELTDGIVVGYNYFGSSEKGNFPELYAPFDLGRTTTHEVGHWLGLRHIWGDGDCTQDDFCNDTPNAEAPNFGCPDSAFSCTSVDMFQNYMDYTYDACMNIFTQCQKDRMRLVLETSPRRKELVVLENPSSNTKLTHSPTLSELHTLNIFPNPFTDHIIISGYQPATIIQWNVYNQMGSLVEGKSYAKKVMGNELALMLNFPEGIYIIETIFSNGSRQFHNIQCIK